MTCSPWLHGTYHPPLTLGRLLAARKWLAMFDEDDIVDTLPDSLGAPR